MRKFKIYACCVFAYWRAWILRIKIQVAEMNNSCIMQHMFNILWDTYTCTLIRNKFRDTSLSVQGSVYLINGVIRRLMVHPTRRTLRNMYRPHNIDHHFHHILLSYFLFQYAEHGLFLTSPRLFPFGIASLFEGSIEYTIFVDC